MLSLISYMPSWTITNILNKLKLRIIQQPAPPILKSGQILIYQQIRIWSLEPVWSLYFCSEWKLIDMCISIIDLWNTCHTKSHLKTGKQIIKTCLHFSSEWKLIVKWISIDLWNAGYPTPRIRDSSCCCCCYSCCVTEKSPANTLSNG